MRAAHAFSIASSPEVTTAFLADPLNVGVSNQRGRILESSGHESAQVGAWWVVQYDQVRTRIEYVRFERSARVDVAMTTAGRGSGGAEGTWAYVIDRDPATGGSRVTVEIDSRTGFVSGSLARLMLPLLWWQLGRRLRSIS